MVHNTKQKSSYFGRYLGGPRGFHNGQVRMSRKRSSTQTASFFHCLQICCVQRLLKDFLAKGSVRITAMLNSHIFDTTHAQFPDVVYFRLASLCGILQHDTRNEICTIYYWCIYCMYDTQGKSNNLILLLECFPYVREYQHPE